VIAPVNSRPASAEWPQCRRRETVDVGIQILRVVVDRVVFSPSPPGSRTDLWTETTAADCAENSAVHIDAVGVEAAAHVPKWAWNPAATSTCRDRVGRWRADQLPSSGTLRHCLCPDTLGTAGAVWIALIVTVFPDERIMYPRRRRAQRNEIYVRFAIRIDRPRSETEDGRHRRVNFNSRFRVKGHHHRVVRARLPLRDSHDRAP